MLKTELLCFQCMRHLSEPGSVCPCCGYDNSRRTNDSGYLGDVVLQGQYYIGKALGRGGFGITYRAMDLFLERVVAVKEYFPATMASRDAGSSAMRTYAGSEQDYQRGCQRAMEEGRMVARIGYVPGVVQVHNVFQANNTVYIVMEYVDGMTLARLTSSYGGRMPWQTLYALMEPLMRSLHTIHGMQIVHRDVSPDNIMVRSADGTAVLLDFGAAHSVSEDGVSEHSVSLRIGYAPAEQYSSVSKQDGRIDEYALCATMYFALTGAKPPDATERLYAGTPLRSLQRCGLTPAMESVLKKGMEVRADDRFPTIAALREAFMQFQPPSPDALASVLPVVRGEMVYPMLQPLPDSRADMMKSIPRTNGDADQTSRMAPQSVQASYVPAPQFESTHDGRTMQAPPDAMAALQHSQSSTVNKKSRARVIVPIAATAAAATAVALGVAFMKPDAAVERLPAATTVMTTSVPTAAATEEPTAVPTEIPTATAEPTAEPTEMPTDTPAPTAEPVTPVPTATPSPLEGMAAGDTVDMYGIVYRMLEDGTLEVADYALDDLVAVIPGQVWERQVTGVGFEALTDCLQLEGVSFNENITYIGEFAFSGSANIKSIALPNSLKEIQAMAFYHCESLDRVHLPDGVTTLGDGAFQNCFALSYIRVPESVTHIGADAFAGCDQLVMDVTPGSYAEQYAYEHGIAILQPAFEAVELRENGFVAMSQEDGSCVLTGYEGDAAEFEVPSSIQGSTVVALGEGCFAGNSHLLSVGLPETVAEIRRDAFAECRSLGSVNVRSDSMYICNAAFAWCEALEFIELPENSVVEPEAFQGAPHLVIDVPAGTDIERTLQEYSYQTGRYTWKEQDGGCAITGYEGTQERMRIPAVMGGMPVTAIEKRAFQNNESIRQVLVPRGVKSIGAWAFDNCVNLEQIALPDTLRVIETRSFRNTAIGRLDLPDSLTRLMSLCFIECPNLTLYVTEGSAGLGYAKANQLNYVVLEDAGSVSHPDDFVYGMDERGAYVCGYFGTARVAHIPTAYEGRKVYAITDSAFFGQVNLQGLHADETLQEIHGSAFAGCSSLTDVQLAESTWYDEDSRNASFVHCPEWESREAEPVRFSYEHDGYGYVVTGGKNIGDVLVIPSEIDGNPVYAVGYDAFSGLDGLRQVVIPDGIKTIEAMAFSNCANLHTVQLPESLNTIGGKAFSNCPSLVNIKLPAGLHNVVSGTFKGSDQLTLQVTAGSVAQRYADTWHIPYELAAETAE